MQSPALHSLLVASRAEELRRAARLRRGAIGPNSRFRWRRRAPSRSLDVELAVTIRFGYPDDVQALTRLAVLDSSPPPREPVLLGEVDGELRAALSLADWSVVADPFFPTASLVELLGARARQLRSTAPAVTGGRRAGVDTRAAGRLGAAASRAD